MEPLGGVIITSREIYDAVVRLTGRVDVLIEQQGQTQHDIQDHEGRLRSLEKGRWPLPSAALLVAIASVGVAIFLK
ncbi:hypothetical protein [Lysinibacillus fusiformis]|uniref:hypothetical protein n=1 Tax=Lysinibacillus fusiformis TaxID=28031 RepID=UPI003D093F67